MRHLTIIAIAALVASAASQSAAQQSARAVQIKASCASHYGALMRSSNPDLGPASERATMIDGLLQAYVGGSPEQLREEAKNLAGATNDMDKFVACAIDSLLSPGQAVAPLPASPSADVSSVRVAASESNAHNPANDAKQCIEAIFRPDFKARRVHSNMGAALRNDCDFDVEVLWCAQGVNCNPGFSNLVRVAGKSDRGISYEAPPAGSKAGRIMAASCRNGFVRTQYKLSPSMQFACN